MNDLISILNTIPNQHSEKLIFLIEVSDGKEERQ